MWVGLNPSTADENQLDPTLRRIKFFTAKYGCNCFYMTNLFAFRATLPTDMKKEIDPVGSENDKHLYNTAKKCKAVVCAWGVHGAYLKRQDEVLKLLEVFDLLHLGKTKEGCPKHPLYVKGETSLMYLDGQPIGDLLT